MQKKTVAILFGGVSPEHGVSCVSAASVMRSIDTNLYDVIKIGITRDGRWLETNATPNEIENDLWYGTEVSFSLSRGKNCGLELLRGCVRPDCIFPVMHGENGEDGSIQGLCKVAGIPCVGCGIAASAIGMDKIFTKQICMLNGIPQADYVSATDDNSDDFASTVAAVENKFDYPVFVKPANTGSSIGVSKAKDRDSLIKALTTAKKYDRRVLIEEFIDGQELEVAVLENGPWNIVSSCVGKIVPAGEFYTYEAKYQDDSELFVSPDIGEEKTAQIKALAERVFSILGCEGLSRVDFFLEKKSGKLIFNEINTLPGFTGISMYPMLMGHSGIAYSDLISILIETAIKKG